MRTKVCTFQLKVKWVEEATKEPGIWRRSKGIGSSTARVPYVALMMGGLLAWWMKNSSVLDRKLELRMKSWVASLRKKEDSVLRSW